MKLARLMDRAPGMTPASDNGGMPAGGNVGSFSPGPTGIASVRPGLDSDGSSTDANTNRPFVDHAV
jgi:hypothetical protein